MEEVVPSDANFTIEVNPVDEAPRIFREQRFRTPVFITKTLPLLRIQT